MAVCRLAADAEIPDWARSDDLLVFIRTPHELSVVCEQRFVPPDVKAERGWRALMLQGPLDFSLVGIIASLTAPLAQAGISVFTLSTFDTDYILLKEGTLEQAVQALEKVGFVVL